MAELNLGICFTCKNFGILTYGPFELMYFCKRFPAPKFVTPILDDDKCDFYINDATPDSYETFCFCGDAEEAEDDND